MWLKACISWHRILCEPAIQPHRSCESYVIAACFSNFKYNFGHRLEGPLSIALLRGKG